MGLGKRAVVKLDSKCCFSGGNRQDYLHGLHVFPRARLDMWEQWHFGKDDVCKALPDEQMATRIDCMNNMLLADVKLHIAWYKYNLAIDPEEDSEGQMRIIDFDAELSEIVRHAYQYLRVEHRPTSERPSQLLLAHHLRQCFLKLIVRPHPSPTRRPSSRDMSSVSSTGLTPQRPSGNMRLTRSMAAASKGTATTPEMLSSLASRPAQSGLVNAHERLYQWRLQVEASSDGQTSSEG